MSLDLNLVQRPVVHIDRIKKTLTIPAFDITCGLPNGSLPIRYFEDLYRSTNNFDMSAYAGVWSMEFWVYIIAQRDTPIFILSKAGATVMGMNTSSIAFRWIPSTQRLQATVNIGGIDVTLQSYFFEFCAWNHIALTSDGATLKLYVNGILYDTDTGGLLTDIANKLYIGTQGNPDPCQFNGFINEIRIWSIALSGDDIRNHMYSPRNADVGLAYYWPLHTDGNEEIANNDMTDNGAVVDIVTTHYYPRRYGSSFVVAEVPVSLGVKSSLRWPTRTPSGANHTLCVAWVDDNGDFQRRKIYGVGSDIAPVPADYRGERLPATYNLEFWNIDGQEDAVLSSQLVLPISITTKPTSSYDTTAIAAQTVVSNTDLATTYPLTFPLTFNTTPAF